MQTSERNDFTSILQAILSGLALLGCLAAAGLFAILGLAGLFGEVVPLSESVSVFILAWVAGFAALLALPSLIYSGLQLMNRPQPEHLKAFGLPLASLLLLVWPLVLALGNALVRVEQISWLAVPPLQILAVAIPIWWLIEVARQKLPGGSPQRTWGLFNFSMFISTPIAVIVEVIVFGLILILVVAFVLNRPDLQFELQRLAQRLQFLQNDPEEILALIRPFLQNPIAVFAILAVLSGLVPLIEELLKPLAIWFIAGHRLSPAEGFVAGALCGGAFALIESLLSVSGLVTEGWAFLLVGRAGTALLHITTTALIGWGLANAWQNEEYARLGIAYLLSVVLHGLWNGLNVVTGLRSVLDPEPGGMEWITSFSTAAPIGLVVLVLILFLILWGGNRILRRDPRHASPHSSAVSSGSTDPTTLNL